INFLSGELTAKRLGLFHELVPAATRVGILVNPANAVNVEATLREVGVAARAIGLQIQTVNASTIREIKPAFTTFVRDPAHAYFTGCRSYLVPLAPRHGFPASYPACDFAEAGGLMSYGANIADAWRQVGSYVGRILKGAKPADLPVCAVDQIRADHQRPDRHDARPHRA